jgi:pyridoxine 5-phosphate synthase
MTALSVNVNKLATLRNSREKNRPDVKEMARDILRFGAQGITVHPRPDGRHIRTNDVFELRELLNSWEGKAEYNIEGFPSPDYLRMVQEALPDQVTLVPDPPEALTSNAGWDLAKNQAQLKGIVTDLKSMGLRVSLFIDPFQWNSRQMEALCAVSPQRVELYTEKFAEDFPTEQRSATTKIYKAVAQEIQTQGIDINAGHDLNLENLGFLLANIPQIKEVSIGHALICEALYLGMETTIHRYLEILKNSK